MFESNHFQNSLISTYTNIVSMNTVNCRFHYFISKIYINSTDKGSQLVNNSNAHTMLK